MKKICAIITVFAAVCGFMLTAAVPCSASSPSEAKDSVVFIQSTFSNYVSADYGAVGGVSGTGSGFAIGTPGKPVEYIVTNAHVVSDEAGNKADSVVVYFSLAANKYMIAQIYRIDYVKDIAVLKLPESTDERKAFVLCKSDDVDMDDNFSALGYPAISFVGNDYLKFDQDDIVITKGGIAKFTMNTSGVEVYMLDLTISSGNSGGPLVNSKGEVVGINTYAYSNGAADANYAVAINELLRLIDRNEIPYTLSTDFDVTPVIWIIAAAAVAAVIVIVVAVIVRAKGKRVPAGVVTAVQQPESYGTGATIVGVNGFYAGRSCRFDENARIGRDADKCLIALPITAPGISGVHCEIARNGGKYTICDLKSSYGTFLGSGVRVEGKPVEIKDGEYFYLGNQEQMFQLKL